MASSQQQIKLYAQNENVRGAKQPVLYTYLPEDTIQTGTSLIIIPGGGYSWLDYKLEGLDVAKELVKKGIACFVLLYRLPLESNMKERWWAPLQDAQQAIKIVRTNASKWKLDPAKVGVLGCSAGGHLAATLSTHFKKSYISNTENISLRPDFVALVYPVISMRKDLTHAGSRDCLIGNDAPEWLVREFSNDEQVTSETPPTWLIHSGADSVVNVYNTLKYYNALYKNKVSAELHIYPKGDHGFVFEWPLFEWMDMVLKWMQNGGWYRDKKI